MHNKLFSRCTEKCINEIPLYLELSVQQFIHLYLSAYTWNSCVKSIVIKLLCESQNTSFSFFRCYMVLRSRYTRFYRTAHHYDCPWRSLCKFCQNLAPSFSHACNRYTHKPTYSCSHLHASMHIIHKCTGMDYLFRWSFMRYQRFNAFLNWKYDNEDTRRSIMHHTAPRVLCFMLPH